LEAKKLDCGAGKRTLTAGLSQLWEDFRRKPRKGGVREALQIHMVEAFGLQKRTRALCLFSIPSFLEAKKL
jgi:hypothetical protein